MILLDSVCTVVTQHVDKTGLAIGLCIGMAVGAFLVVGVLLLIGSTSNA